MSETTICESKGKTYDGLRNNKEHNMTYLIQPGSVHERMIYDYIETRIGLHHTALLLNKNL